MRKKPKPLKRFTVPPFSEEARQRIALARANAELQLKRDLDPFQHSTDYRDCLPAFEKFASALFDAEAQELIPLVPSKKIYMQLLDVLRKRIVDQIMPPDDLPPHPSTLGRATKPS